MKTFTSILILIFALFSCSQNDSNEDYFVEGTPESVGLESEKLQPIYDTIKTWVDQGKLMGAEVLIIKDGQVIMHEAEGWSDFEEKIPLQKNSIYNIRSQSKLFTSISMMQLVEKGLVNLDDPVSKYLNSFNNERSKDITIHQLMSHTAGLDLVYEALDKPREDYGSLEALIDAIGEHGPASEIGVMHYSDEGAYTAARVVSIISGLSPQEYTQKYILDPMELNDTYLHYDPEVSWRERMNSTYAFNGPECNFVKFWDKNQFPQNPYIGVGDIRSTTLDYAQLLQILMNEGRYKGKTLLSKESLDLMKKTHGEWQIGKYGYFLMTDRDPETNELLWFGHGGSDGTLAFAFPEINTIVMYYTQSRFSAQRPDFFSTLRNVEYFKPYVPETKYMRDKKEKIKMVNSKSSVSTLNPKYLGQYDNFNLELDNDAYKLTANTPIGVKTATCYAFTDNELYGYFDHCDKYILGFIFEEKDNTIKLQLTNAQKTIRQTRVKNGED